jgi:hypothetical protein
MDRLSDRIDGVDSRVDEVRDQLTDRFDARIAKLERRLLVAGIPTVAAGSCWKVGEPNEIH